MKNANQCERGRESVGRGREYFVLSIEAENAKKRKRDGEDRKKTVMHRKYRQRSLFPHVPEDRKTRILDIGCGDGSVLLLLREMGYENISGIDLSPENVALCHEAGLGCVDKHDALALESYRKEDGPWDVVLCMDIIEHIPPESTVGLLLSIRQRLAPGGRVVVQTPNLAYCLSNWVRYADPTHTTGFTEKSLATVLRSAGFARVEVYPVWHATTLLGRSRELYVRFMHKLFYLAEGSSAAKVAARGIIAVGFEEQATEAANVSACRRHIPAAASGR